MSQGRPRAILWDNDGVLVDTEVLYFRATRETLDSVGFELTEALFREHFLTRSQGVWHMLEGHDDASVASLRASRDARFTSLIESEPIAIDGAAGVLEALSRHLSMGVVTSSRRSNFEAIHARTGFDAHFEFVVTGDDVAATKPNPEPYLRGLEHAGCAPHEALAIEDSERGLAAARAAGIRCWVIPTPLSADGDFSAAERVVERIEEVPALLGLDPLR